MEEIKSNVPAVIVLKNRDKRDWSFAFGNSYESVSASGSAGYWLLRVYRFVDSYYTLYGSWVNY
jgi:hypothetical protein